MAIVMSVVVWRNKSVVRIEKVIGEEEEEEWVECRKGSGSFNGERK
jgi:hypothetical protein